MVSKKNTIFFPSGVRVVSSILPIILPGSKRPAGKKVVANILVFLLLVGGVAAGVVLVGQKQEIEKKAVVGGGYRIEVFRRKPDGSLVKFAGAKPRRIVRYMEVDGSEVSPSVCYQGSYDGRCSVVNDCFGEKGLFEARFGSGGPCGEIEPGGYMVSWDKQVKIAGVSYRLIPTANLTCGEKVAYCSQSERLLQESGRYYYHYAIYEPEASGGS